MAAAERYGLMVLALATAAFLPFALNRFVFPKLAVTVLGLLLASFVPARGRLPGHLRGILLAGAAWLTLSALAAAMPAEQLIGLPPRYEGVVALPVYLGAGAAGARLLGPLRARGSTGWFLRWLAVAAIAVGLVAVLEAAGLRPLVSNVSRPGSLLGNASDEGAWAVLALFPLTAAALRVGGRLYTAGAVAAAVTLVCSGSRGALLGALAGVLVLMALLPTRALRTILVVAVAAIAVGVFALPATRARVTGTSRTATQTVHGRVLLARETLDLVRSNPLLGVGPSGYLNAIPRVHTAAYERQIGPANPPDSPHDWVLQAAAAGGIPLALLALLLAGLTVSRGVRAVRRQPTGGESAVFGGLLAALIGYGVALLFHFTSPGTTPLAAFFGGALLAIGPEGDPPLSSNPPPGPSPGGKPALRLATRIATRVVLALALAALTAAAAAEIPLRSAIYAAASGSFTRADQDFDLARALRPWDPAVTATAAHAYVVLAGVGFAAATPYARRWVATELSDYPGSIQALTDAGSLALAERDRSGALRFFRRALRLDPQNPALRDDAASAAALSPR